jgi:hypothetical protein
MFVLAASCHLECSHTIEEKDWRLESDVFGFAVRIPP